MMHDAKSLEAAQEARAKAALDLARAAFDYSLAGAYSRAACYYEAAARIAPASGPWQDYRAAADVMEKAASDLVTQSHDLARKEAAAAALHDFAFTLATMAQDKLEAGGHYAAAALWAAAAMASPEALAAEGWNRGSRGAEAEGRRRAAYALKEAARKEQGIPL